MTYDDWKLMSDRDAEPQPLPTCAECGAEFWPRRNEEYCSPACEDQAAERYWTNRDAEGGY